jgi:hypothetical protein
MSPDANGDFKKVKKNSETDVIELLNHSDEYSIFKTIPIKELIEFKWNTYGFGFHLIGFVFHFAQLTLLIYYNYHIYIKDGLYEYVETDDISVLGGLERIPISRNNENTENTLAFLLFVGLLYPSIYTFILIFKIGPINLIVQPHEVDTRVYVNLVYVALNIFNILVHRTYDPQEFVPKLLMIIVLCFVTLITFGFLRIISAFSPLVQMLSSVIADLK